MNAALLAQGRLAAIKAGHVCGTPCTSKITRPDGSITQLVCPWENLDPTEPVDQRIIQTVYTALVPRRSLTQ